MLDSNEVPTFNHYSQLHTIVDIGLNEIRASKSQLCDIHFKVIPFGDIGPNGERFTWNFNRISYLNSNSFHWGVLDPLIKDSIKF